MEYTIYTYGGGEFVAKVFDGIAMIFGGQNKEFNAVIQLSMVIGAFWISIKAIYGHNIGIFAKSWFVPSLIILGVFVGPKTRVNIHDISGYVTQKDHIPYGIALVTSVSSMIGHRVTEMIEDTLKPVDDNPAYRFGKTGPMFGAKVLASMKNIRIHDATLRDNVKEFMNRCYTWPYVITDIQGKREEALQSSDILGFVQENAHPGLGMYWKEGGETSFKACSVAAREVKTKIEGDSRGEGVLTQLKGLLGLTSLTGKGSLDRQVNMNLLLKTTSGDAWQIIREQSGDFHRVSGQQMMMNAFKEGYDDLREKHGHQRLYPELINLQAGRSIMQQNSGWLVGGAAIAEYLPLAQTVIFMMLIVATVLILPLSFMPGGYQLLGTWVKMMIWVQSWPIFFSIINGIAANALESQTDLLIAGGGGLNLVTQDGMADVAFNIYCITQGFMISVPMISWALINQGGYALVNMMDRFSPASLGASMGSSMVDNNTSFDNMSIGNRSFANTQMAQQTIGAMTQSGMQFSDGRYAQNMSTGGIETITESQTSLLTQVGYNFTNDNTFSEVANKSRTAMQSKQQSYNEALARSEQLTHEHNMNIMRGMTYDQSLSEEQRANIQNALNRSYGSGSSTNERSGINESKSVDASLGVSASANAGLKLGFVGGSVSGTASSSMRAGADKVHGMNREEYNKLSNEEQTYFQNLHASSTSQNIKHSSDSSERTSDALRESLDQTNRLSSELSALDQEAHRYEQMANYQRKHGMQINQNIAGLTLQKVADDNGWDLKKAATWQTTHQSEFAGVAREVGEGYRQRLMSLAADSSFTINEQNVQNASDSYFNEFKDKNLEAGFGHTVPTGFEQGVQQTMYDKEKELKSKNNTNTQSVNEMIRSERSNIDESRSDQEGKFEESKNKNMYRRGWNHGMNNED